MIIMKQFTPTSEIMNRDASSLSLYFNDLKKIESLSAQSELVIAQRVKEGDIVAYQSLVKSNLRFVVSVAKRYQNRGVSITDLINEGNLGLMTAAQRYDASQGFKFITYAVWWIRQSIISAIAEQSRLIHIPYNIYTLLGKVRKSQAKLEQLLKRKPSDKELAEDLQMDVDKLSRLLNQFNNETSLDQPLSSTNELTLLDLLKCTDNNLGDFSNEDKDKAINRVLSILSDKQKQIIIRYFGLKQTNAMSLEDIADYLDLSVEHTRRLKDKALARIRCSNHAAFLQSFIN